MPGEFVKDKLSAAVSIVKLRHRAVTVSLSLKDNFDLRGCSEKHQLQQLPRKRGAFHQGFTEKVPMISMVTGNLSNQSCQGGVSVLRRFPGNKLTLRNPGSEKKQEA